MTIALTALISSLLTLAIVLLVANIRIGRKTSQHHIEADYSVADEQFLRTASGLLPPPPLPGHRIQTLLNGDQIFPAMLDAIRAARQTINLETFIYWSGWIGRQMAEALAERARAGVRVNVMLDWLGSNKADPADLELMQRAGVAIQRFHKPRQWRLSRLNERTHRKLLIVDGRVGFTGGVGIADPWLGHAQDPEHWRDTHFRIEGPAVAQLQAAFVDNWLKTHSHVLHGDDYFPPLQPAGPCTAQVLASSPDAGVQNVRLMYLMALACARRSVLLSAAYFVPDCRASQELIRAARRGVKVQIIVPGPHIDWQVVRWASRAQWGPLLQAGVEIHEYLLTMFHVKVMVVDELWASGGSTNFDSRSFYYNDEANLNVFDANFARQQAEIFRQDLTRCRPITYAQWQRRPLRQRLRETVASLVSGQV